MFVDQKQCLRKVRVGELCRLLVMLRNHLHQSQDQGCHLLTVSNGPTGEILFLVLFHESNTYLEE